MTRLSKAARAKAEQAGRGEYQSPDYALNERARVEANINAHAKTLQHVSDVAKDLNRALKLNGYDTSSPLRKDVLALILPDDEPETVIIDIAFNRTENEHHVAIPFDKVRAGLAKHGLTITKADKP